MTTSFYSNPPIEFGVATVGFRYKIVKIDGSIFTGREPNEQRYNIDKPRFDSYSYRLTVNPSRFLSMQVSQGFIKSPEELNPGEDIWRTTASINHSLPLMGENSFLTSAVVWEYNDSGEGHKENRSPWNRTFNWTGLPFMVAMNTLRSRLESFC